MPFVDTLIARLQADCTAAEAAERAVRASVEAQIKAAEAARAFAWRRLKSSLALPRIAGSGSDTPGNCWAWAAYLGASWTWCIGMFLPVLLTQGGRWCLLFSASQTLM